MGPKITLKAIAVIVVIVLLLSVAVAFVIQFLGQSSLVNLKVLAVTGQGLQETYGFYSENHVSNGFNYYRDVFWTESTSRWTPSTTAATVSVDSSAKVHGSYSILFDFNARYSSYYFYHLSRQYGYLAKEGDKWLYFNARFNNTALISEFEVRAADYTGANYFSTKYTHISNYKPSEWIRFSINMGEMSPFGSPTWSDISRLQFNIQQQPAAPLKVWIDDIMITSDYHYNLALENLRTLFKGISIEARDYDRLPANLNDYTAIIYLDNRINSTGISLIDQYVNQGGGLVLMGLSTLWQSDGTERVDFPLSSSPVSVLNTTETFIAKAEKADSFENHSALKPWSDYAVFEQKGFAGARPKPNLGVAEVYSVSLRADSTPLVTESGYIYEAAKQHGAGKVVYFAENLAKRIANGMLEAYGLMNGFGSLGWAGPTGDRLQLLESAINFVSKQPLPKFLITPDAKKGGFVFTVDTSASIRFYSYLNKTCTRIAGLPSNDTAFWYTVERMKNLSEEIGITFTLLIATEQLANEYRANQTEIEFDPRNVEALKLAYQSANIEIGLSASNTITWGKDAASFGDSYINMWQGIIDIQNALNLSEYEPLIWRYPNFIRRGESMYATKEVGLYLDATDGNGDGGIPYSDSVAVPYMMEVGTWKLQNRASFSSRVESNEVLRKREEAYFDWYVENDMIYTVHSDDLAVAADPSHIHQEIGGTRNYTSSWSQTPIFLEYVSAQGENTWIVGGVTLAQYLKSWTVAHVATTYNSRDRTYTFTISNAPDGLTVRLPLNGLHLSTVTSEAGYIQKEQGDYAYVAVKNPKSLETVTVTIGSTGIAGTILAPASPTVGVCSFVATVPIFLQQRFKTCLKSEKKSISSTRVDL